MSFVIFDWAGNHLSAHGSFRSFEEGWDYILGEMTDRLSLTEEDYGEYYVLEEKPLREKRYLDPFDPRAGNAQ